MKKILPLIMSLFLTTAFAQKISDIKISANAEIGCSIKAHDVHFNNPDMKITSHFGLPYLSDNSANMDLFIQCSPNTIAEYYYLGEEYYFNVINTKRSFGLMLKHTLIQDEYPIPVYIFNNRNTTDNSTIMNEFYKRTYIGTGKADLIPVILIVGNSNYFFGTKYNYRQGTYQGTLNLVIDY